MTSYFRQLDITDVIYSIGYSFETCLQQQTTVNIPEVFGALGIYSVINKICHEMMEDSRAELWLMVRLGGIYCIIKP